MDKEKFNQLCSVLISVFTVFAALITYAQTDASQHESEAARDSQRYALKVFGLKARGHAESNFAYYEAFKSYYQLQQLAGQATDSESEITSEIYESTADELTEHSVVFKDYFNDEDGSVDILRFEADLYVLEAARLDQNYQAASSVKVVWNSKATTHIAHLTLMAVSLFLLGQASSLRGESTRKVMLGFGSLLAAGTILWTLIVWARPVHDLRETGAIDYYAKGVALEHQDLTKEAAAEFDQAIKAAPNYFDAYVARGQSLLYLERYVDAAADFEKALALDSENSQVAASLARAYYEQGEFQKCLKHVSFASMVVPESVEYRALLGLATLASGQTDKARERYQEVSETATRVVAMAREKNAQPPSFIWENLDDAALDLEELQSAAEGEGGTPPQDKILNPEKVIENCLELQYEIGGLSVSLEYKGKPAGAKSGAQLTDLTFGLPVYKDGELESEIKEYPESTFPAGTGEVVVEFEFENVQDGQELVMKVFYDADELPSWRLIDIWENDGGEDETTWYKVLSPGYSEATEMNSGRYVVEFYLDGHLYLKDGFDISESEEE